MTSNQKLVLFFIFVFSALNRADLQTQRQCTTPDGKQGQCGPVKECQPILEFLRNSAKPIPMKTIQKLKEYMCDAKDNTTAVCCPPDSIRFNNTDDQSDIENHKNIALLPTECGYINTGDKIRNGENAKILEFPWMALLSYNTSRGPLYNCGGTIINDRYILTAAHCIVGTPDPLIGIRIGEYDLSTEIDCEDTYCLPPVQDLTIERIIVHPEYNITRFSNDIGLIRVSKINLTVENAKPVCLPTTEEIRNQKYNIAVVTGWGATNRIGKRANILQQVGLPVHNLTVCIKAYEKLRDVKFSENQLCAGGSERKDSCGGDSGGPLHSAAHFNDENRYVQQGIVSIGHAYCGLEGYPSVFTKVASYTKWILDTIQP